MGSKLITLTMETTEDAAVQVRPCVTLPMEAARPVSALCAALDTMPGVQWAALLVTVYTLIALALVGLDQWGRR